MLSIALGRIRGYVIHQGFLERTEDFLAVSHQQLSKHMITVAVCSLHEVGRDITYSCCCHHRNGADDRIVRRIISTIDAFVDELDGLHLLEYYVLLILTSLSPHHMVCRECHGSLEKDGIGHDPGDPSVTEWIVIPANATIYGQAHASEVIADFARKLD